MAGIKNIRHFYRAATNKIRANFYTKLLCGVVCFALIPTIVLIFITCWIYSARYNHELEQHADSSLQLVQNSIDGYLDKALTESLIATKMQAINNVILNKDIAELQLLIFELKSIIGADLIIITDEQENVLLQTRDVEENFDFLLRRIDFNRALIENQSSKRVIEGPDKIFLTATAPILNWASNGTITIAYLLNEKTLRSIKGHTNIDIILLHEDGTATSTFVDDPPAIQKITTRILSKQSDTFKKLYSKIKLGNKRYQIICSKLSETNSNNWLIIAIPIGTWYLELFKLQYYFIGIVFVLITTLILTVYKWGKTITKPLYSILEFSKRQNFSDPILDKNVEVLDEFSVIKHAIIDMSKMMKKSAHLAAIGESTAMVAHDVRKPLTSMKALLGALPAIGDNPAQVEKMIADVDRNIAQTNTLLNDILDFSRDSTALDLKEHNPQSIVVSSLGDALRNHPGADVEIKYDFNHNDRSIYADGARIIRVLTNLIDNALDAITPDNSDKAVGSLLFKSYLAIKNEKEVVGISVADSGPGIPEETLEKIFDPFFTKGKKGGTGLGLAICQRVITMHGGKIEAKNSSVTGGAEFAIELTAGTERVAANEAELIHHSKELRPFRQEEAARTDFGDTANTAEFMRINKERGRISNLLMVDDEPLFRESVKSLLDGLEQVKDHVRFIEAESAEAGLQLLSNSLRASLPTAGESRSGDGGSRQARTVTGGFDYVIADIDLGKRRMNGYDFAQKVLAEYPNIYVLIHSNKRKEELDIHLRQRCRGVQGSHFMGFLPKPMKASELLQFLACKTFENTKPPCPPLEKGGLKKVLLLNDDKNFNLTMRIIMKNEGIKVLESTTVNEAMSHLSANEFDAILSDINLGQDNPNGYEFLKQVREKNSRIPFVFASGYSKTTEWPKAEKLGATGYLQLPFEPNELKEMLKWS